MSMDLNLADLIIQQLRNTIKYIEQKLSLHEGLIMVIGYIKHLLKSLSFSHSELNMLIVDNL